MLHLAKTSDEDDYDFKGIVVQLCQRVRYAKTHSVSPWVIGTI